MDFSLTPGERKRRVLAVDDNEMIREMLQQLLTRLGYEVISAADGIEGLEKVNTHDVDLILLDLDMPRMEGIELLKILALDEKLRKIPVVVMTGSGSPRAVEAALKAGALEVIAKPFEIIVLRQAIHRHLTD